MRIPTQILALLPMRRRRQVPLVIFLMIVGAVFEVVGISLIIPLMEFVTGDRANVVTQIVTSRFKTHSNQDLILLGVCVFSLIYVLKGLYLSLLAWVIGRFTYNTKAEIGNSIMNNYLSAPYEFHLKNNSAQLIRNVTTEANQLVLYALNPTLVIATESAVIIAVSIFLISIEPIGTIAVILLLIILSFGFQKVVGGYSSKLGKLRQDADGLVIQKSQEALGGIKDVKVLGKTLHFSEQFCQQNWISSDVSGKQHALGQLPRMYLETIGVLVLSVLVFVLTQRAGNFLQIIPTLSVFGLAAFRLLPSANRILSSVNSLRYAESVVNTLRKQQDLYPKDFLSTENDQYKSPDLPFVSCIELNNLSYKYPDTQEDALSNISLTINKGESIGVVGKSGAGKSTLSDIILGLIVPISGSVTVDGVNIQKNIGAWQQKIGYVQQDIFLLDDNIRKNIAFGLLEDQIDYKRMNEVIIEARLDELVSSLADGLNTQLGERGVRLSGGQKQRIGIARALYRDTPFLVFDEATSALDNETESEIVSAIKALKSVKTVIVIAHRLSTIEHCDKIIELRNGKVLRSLK